MNESVQFYLREGTRSYRCAAFDGEVCIAATLIMTTSAEEAVQSMAQNVIEGSGGDWTSGKIEIREQGIEDGAVRTFLVSSRVADLGNGEAHADVTIEEA